MGLTRITQLLAGSESTEGTAVALSTGNFIDARSLARTISQDIEDEVVSGSSLSSDLGVIGRGSFGVTFNTRHYGLDWTLPPLDDPLMRAAALQRDVVPYFTVSVAPTVATWAGMTLLDSSAGTATLAAPIGASGRCYYVGATGGFPNADTTLEVQGVSGSGFTIASATPAGTCWAYRPDSQATANVALTAAGWTGTAPNVGDVVTNNLNGVDAARGVVVSIFPGVTTTLEIQPILPGRAFLAGETVAGTAAGRTGTNTVAAGGQTLARVPSLTMKAHIGGHAITGVGMRGNMTINFEAGKIPLAEWSFEGSRSSTASEQPLGGITTVSASSIARWQSATANLDGFEIPLANASLTLGNTVSLLADAHGAQGVRGSTITAREPSLTLDPDRVSEGVYNYITRMQNGTPVSVFTMWGSTVGLRQALWIPRGQIYQQGDGDREGTLTAQLTVRPKRRTGSGDDEIYLFYGM